MTSGLIQKENKHNHSNEVRVGDAKPRQSLNPPLPALDWYISRILANLSWRPTSCVALDSGNVVGSVSLFDSNPETS